MASSSGDLARGLRVLRERNFRWFFLAQCTSMLGDGMVAPALAFAVLGLPGGGVVGLGLVLAAGTAAQVLCMPAGGVIADRLPRNALMLGCDLARAASQGIMAVLLISGTARVWQILVLQVVHGVAVALFLPAVPGIVQATTRADQRQPANALRVLALSVSLIAGPAIAGVLVVGVGPGWAVGVDAATFAASAGCLSRVRLRHASGRGRRFARELADGWREFRSRRWVWSVIGAASLVNLCSAAFSVLGPMVSRLSLGGPGAWALISAMFGAGCLGGGVIALCVRPRYPLRSGVAVMAAFACPTFALAAGLTAVAVAAAAFCGGLVLVVFNTFWETALQQHIPAATLSRVTAYEWVGASVGQPLGLAMVAPVAVRLGLHPTLWTAGALQILVTLAPLLIPEVRALPGRHGHH